VRPARSGPSASLGRCRFRRSVRRDGAHHVALGGLSGGLLIFAFAPTDLWWLAFFALAPWLSRLPEDPRAAAGSGFVAGLTFFLGTLWWIAWTMLRYADLPPGLALPGALAVLFALAGYLALYVAVFGAALAWMRPGSGPAFVMAAAGLWVALEYGRTHLLTGFPWNLAGDSQYENVVLLPLAAVTGVYGLSFVLLTVNAALAWTVQRWGVWVEIGRAWATAVGVLVLAAVPGWAAGPPRTSGEPVDVAVIQGNIDQAVKWDVAQVAETVVTYQRLTQVAATEHRPGLIVWPETAVPFSLDGDGRREAVLTIARLVRTPLLVGAPHREGDGRRVYNSAFLVDGAGAVTGRYDKRHLVPFGEYVPWRRILFFADWFVSGGIGDFTPGTREAILASPAGRLAVTICFEAIFPAEVRRAVAEGADFLVNLTNDAWFGRTPAPYQHLAMVVLRAVENGIYVVRAANTGISAIVAPDGRIVRASGLFTREIVAGLVAARPRSTFYTRYGDVFAVAILVGVGGALLAAAASRRVAGVVGASR